MRNMRRTLLINHIGLPQQISAGVVVALTCVTTGIFSAGARAELCPNEAFRTGPSVNLPDCRAYELVSPAFKEGAALNIPYLSSDGSHVIVSALGAFAGTQSEANNALAGPVYELSRTGSGWAASPLDPPASEFPNLLLLDTSSDLTKTLWEMREPSQSVDEGSLYIREAGGHFVRIGPLIGPGQVGSGGLPGGSSSEGLPFEIGVVYEGASADLSHVFMSYQPAEGTSLFWPGDSTLELAHSLYEYSGTGVVRPELVGVNNEGKLISNCGTELGGVGDKYNAVSVSGESLFFTARHETGASVACSSPAVNELYTRIDRSETIPISEPSFSQCNNCRTGTPTTDEPAVTEQSAVFQGASKDGSKVFFTTEQELLEGQVTENLYEFDFNNPLGQRVVLVSKGSSTPEVQGVARVSEDGSHVYFVAKGVLAAGATAGEDNLYLFERNATHPQGRVTFVTTLSAGDERDWSESDERPVQTTPEGRFLVFESASQVFEYDAKEETLVNISSGHAAEIKEPAYTLASSPTIAQSKSSISSDGSTLFFTSREALTPRAEVAAAAGAESVYEYRNEGSISNGNVSLISDGKDIAQEGVELYGSDLSGEDVFFRTTDPLVVTDDNTELDLYDAKVNGGFLEPPIPTGCTGEACQGTPSSSPLFGLPESSSTPGGGNLVPATPSTLAVTKSKHGMAPLTRAQKLAEALKVCKKKPKKQRTKCNAQARKRYGGKSKAKKSGDRRVG